MNLQVDLGANRRAIGVLALSVLLSACSALPSLPNQPDSANAAPAEVLLYAEASRGDDLGRIVVPVLINDQGPFYFLLDTGATHSVLSKPLVSRLSLQLNENDVVAVRGVNGLRHVPTTTLRSFKAGALEAHDVAMPVLSTPVLDGLDGILGMDQLADTRVTADLSGSQVRIVTANGEPASGDHKVVAFSTLAHRLVLVDAYIGRIKVNAVIDTGGAHTLANEALLKQLLLQTGGRIEGLQTGIVDATDASQPAIQVRVPRIRIGAMSIENLPVAFGKFSVFDTWGINDKPSLMIGMDVLGLLQGFSIDYRRKELQIVSAHAAADTATPVTR
jgi:predicted aspartyl protease